MNTYAINEGGYQFQRLMLQVTDIEDIAPEEIPLMDIHYFSDANLEMSSWWKPLETSFEPAKDFPDAVIPDITPWKGSSLALSKKAFDILEPHLANFGELLPIKIGNTDFFIFNCLTHGQIDEINSRPRPNFKIAFNEQDIKNKLIFKTPHDVYTRAYCSDSFRKLVENNKLSGICFTEISQLPNS